MGLFNFRKKHEPPEIEKKSSDVYTQMQINSLFNSVSLNPDYAYWLYEKSDVVGDAVERLAWAFQQLEPFMRDKSTGEITNRHPALELISDPGMISSDRFKFELFVSFLLTGSVYPILTGNVKYEPTGLYICGSNNANLMPDSLNYLQTIILNKHGIVSYDRVDNRGKITYQTRDGYQETKQIKNIGRRNSLDGQSPLERVYQQALSKYYGNVHNANILKTGVRAGGMISPKEPLAQNEFEAFKDSAKTFESMGHRGRYMITSAPVDYQDFLINPRDMDFVKLIDSSRIDVYSQYQIPLPLVLSSTMTMGNFENAITAFYDISLLPRAKFMWREFGRFLLARYKDGDRYEFVINEKDITALKTRQLEQAKKMREIYAYSEDEIRTVTGYESLGEEGRLVYKPANMIPVESDDYTLDNITREPNKPEEEQPEMEEENDEE